MLFKKLFQLLVVGGAVLGGSSGCSTTASSQTGPDKSGAGASASSTPQGADAGVKPEKGGGVSGW